MPHAFTAPDAPGSSARTMIARLRPFLKSLALIVLLPLALLALGLWEVERGASSLADLKRSQAELPQALARLRAMAAQNPHAVVRFEGAKSAVTAELAVRQVEGWVQGLETDLLLAKARDVLAWATVAGSALLLAAGLAGLLLSAAARALGRLSRDRLVSAFAMLRRVLPILLGAQTAGFAVAIVSAGLFEAGGLWLADRVSVGEVKLLLSVILLGGVAIYAAVAAIRGLRRAFALFTPEPLDVLGRAVDETQAASLWRFTRELARRQEALEPDHVVVGLTEGFFVTSADVRLWPEERVLTGRTLYVPAPALALLNGREVAAIVGHELAHFSGEDTLYSQRFAPIYAGFERALAALSRNQAGNVFVLWPAIALGALTLYAFDTAVAGWRREREFEADRRGSVVSGPDAAASALVRTAVAAPIIHAVLEGAADAPERADADLVAAVAAAAAREGFETPQAHLDDRQPHPTDSHPPIRQRLAALQVAPDHPLLARATRPVGDEERAFAPALFADWPALCGDLSRDLLGRMREHDAAVRTVLERTIAAGPAEETPLFENTGPVIWTFGIMAALLTAAAAATVVFAAPLGLSTNPVVQSAVAAGLLAAALGLVAYAWAVHRRRHEPYLVLTPEGFRSPLLQAPIAWTSVADCRISHDRRLALTVALAPDAPLPAKTRRALKVRVSSRRREVTIESAGVRGLKPQAYAQLVGRYLDGARARAMLAGRDAA